MFDFTTDSILRILAINVFIVWSAYWFVSGSRADREKPKIVRRSFLHKDNIRKAVLRIIVVILILQLIGMPLLQIPNASILVQILGVTFVIAGAIISISARKELGANWAHAFEYQIKAKQVLVTSGIYKYIRHPIYVGVVLGYVGGELVAQSYLALLSLILVWGAYHQAKLEEKLLLSHYKESYIRYINKTRMFIPYLW
jgi:protein-S-isoprenylcysteine O-methyltransferase Ste14